MQDEELEEPEDGLTPASTEPAARPTARQKLRAEVSSLPMWKKLLLGLAGVFMLAGGALGTLGGGTPQSAQSSGSSQAPTTGAGADSVQGPEADADGVPRTSARSTGLRSGEGSLPGLTGPTGTGEPQPDGAAEDQTNMWTPFLLKGGFSFFVAFCVGFALRAFFKISAVALGALFLSLFLLSYVGVVQVDWSTLGNWFDSARGAVSEEFASFRQFISGSLPSAASATLGLVAGFKR